MVSVLCRLISPVVLGAWFLVSRLVVCGDFVGLRLELWNICCGFGGVGCFDLDWFRLDFGIDGL